MDLETLQKYYFNNSHQGNIPEQHIEYLKMLKKTGFEPKVIYDIGAHFLYWTKNAKILWPDATIILFDAIQTFQFLYYGHQYFIGVLSNVSGKIVKFYSNDFYPGGSSYYKEIGSPQSEFLFPEDSYQEMKTTSLDDVVKEFNFPLPDFVKIDVQGAEKDILEGGINTMKNTKRLILEIPKDNVEYNKGAPSGKKTLEYAKKLGWICTDPLFCDNSIYDGDYGFIKEDV